MGRDLNAVLDDIGMGAYHWVQTLLLGGVLIADGAEILVCSSILNALKEQWDLTPMVRGLMMSTIFVGVLVGGIIGGNISDAYGRRKGIMCSYLGICIFGIATAAAQGPISMLILRFFFGASFGCGMGPGITMQVETSPTPWRAHIVNLGGLFFTFGEVYTSVLLIIFMPELTDPTGDSWRWVTGLSMIPGFVLLPFTLLLLQESPMWLMAVGRMPEAIGSLQYIAHMNNAADKVEGLDSDDPQKKLEYTGSPEAAAAAAAEAAAKAADAESAAAALLESNTASASSSSAAPAPRERRRSIEVAKESGSVLFSAEYRSIVFGGAYLCMLCNFLFYGLTYALPQMFGDLHGIVSPAVQVLIVSACDLPGILLGWVLIAAKGISHRAGLSWLAGFCMVFSISLISIENGVVFVGLPSAYLIKYVSSALFTLTYVYISEVFPARVRATGVSICIASGRLGSMTAPVIVEAMKKKGYKYGEHMPFLLFTAGLCALAIVVIKTCLHFERKNAALTDTTPPKDSKEAREPSLKKEVDISVPAAAG